MVVNPWRVLIHGCQPLEGSKESDIFTARVQGPQAAKFPSPWTQPVDSAHGLQIINHLETTESNAQHSTYDQENNIQHMIWRTNSNIHNSNSLL